MKKELKKKAREQKMIEYKKEKWKPSKRKRGTNGCLFKNSIMCQKQNN
jgi:UDP-N-acetylenolpyruvoylglucosamine reductase